MLEHGTLKRAPFSYPRPCFVPHCKEPCAHVCGHPGSHIQAPSIASAKAAPWPSSGPMATRTNSSVHPSGQSCEEEALASLGAISMLFQSLGDLKFVLEDMHSSVWLCVFGLVDSLCFGEPYDWREAHGGLRVNGSSGWCQQLLVGGWAYLRWSKIERPLMFPKSKIKCLTLRDNGKRIIFLASALTPQQDDLWDLTPWTRIKPRPQQWNHWVLNPLNHQGVPWKAS